MASDVEVLDIVELRRKVAFKFPDETVHAVVPFRLKGKRLLEQWKKTPDNVELLLELLRLAVPSASDEDFDSLSLEEDIPRVLAAADGKIALMEAALKNGLSGVDAPPPAPPSMPSSPTTPTRTRSRGSRGPSVSPPPT